MSDNVNKPAHYNAGSIETIDGIRAALGEGFADYCRGNVLKYVWRCGKKGDGVEDLRKAATYLQWAIEAMEGNCPVMPDSSNSKPIAIPSGWRELKPDEVPKATDMHEWMGGWFYRNDDATNEYKWHSSRHIRKIEADERKQPAIPEGWRELEPDEFPRVTDMYESEGAWRKRINDSSIEYARYDVRQIRKIETANTSETPNSSTPTEWIPKVGDKVRLSVPVLYPVQDSCNYEGRVNKIAERGRFTIYFASEDGKVRGWVKPKHIQLVEAAS